MMDGICPFRPAAIASISSAGPATFIGSGTAYTHWFSMSTAPPEPHTGGHLTAGSQNTVKSERESNLWYSSAIPPEYPGHPSPPFQNHR